MTLASLFLVFPSAQLLDLSIYSIQIRNAKRYDNIKMKTNF